MMQTRKWGTILVSLSFSYLARADESAVGNSAAGFMEGSQLTVLLRNEYFNHDNTQHRADQKDWSQAARVQLTSGFSQGFVGLGFDAFAYENIKLDGGAGTVNTGNLPIRRDGSPANDYGVVGGALKARLGQTTLSWGNLQPSAPVFAAGGSRQFPQTATGFMLTSADLEHLNLEAGHFTASNGPVTTNNRQQIYATYANLPASKMDYLGGRYSATDALSLQLYGSQLQDMWRQYYANVNYVWVLDRDQSVNLDTNLYRTLSTGRSLLGPVDNTAWSVSAGIALSQAHSVKLTYQKIHGDTPFDYVAFGENKSGDTGDSIYLGNSSQYADFNGPGERSLQARYDLNMAGYGVPGLDVTIKYTHGTGIDGTHMPDNSVYQAYDYGSDGKHRETDVGIRYVLQSGSAKGLSFALNLAFHRANADQAEGNGNESVLIISKAFELL